MQQLRPSPAISVPANTSIRETLRIMREHNVGSVLVMAYAPPHALEGIFTERDLLKWVGEIEKNQAWDKDISTIMTKSMVTLNLMEVDRAPEVMFQHSFRHLPIVYESDGFRQVAGVISMRDLFKRLVAERKQKTVLERYQGKRVVVLAHSKRERDLQKNLLETHVDFQLIDQDFDSTPIDLEAAIPTILAGDLFLLDLDHFSSETWVKVLKKLLSLKKRPPMFVVYDPVLQDPKNIAALKQLSQGSVLQVFPKPINLLEYLRQIEKQLR